jgi:hypothetical protein
VLPNATQYVVTTVDKNTHFLSRGDLNRCQHLGDHLTKQHFINFEITLITTESGKDSVHFAGNSLVNKFCNDFANI